MWNRWRGTAIGGWGGAGGVVVEVVLEPGNFLVLARASIFSSAEFRI